MTSLRVLEISSVSCSGVDADMGHPSATLWEVTTPDRIAVLEDALWIVCFSSQLRLDPLGGFLMHFR